MSPTDWISLVPPLIEFCLLAYLAAHGSPPAGGAA